MFKKLFLFLLLSKTFQDLDVHNNNFVSSVWVRNMFSLMAAFLLQMPESKMSKKIFVCKKDAVSDQLQMLHNGEPRDLYRSSIVLSGQ
jgi:hypothetical protein